MTRWAYILAGLSLILSGLVQGIWSDRWGNISLFTHQPQLEDLPCDLAGWFCEKLDVPEALYQAIGAYQIIRRTYRSPSRDDNVEVLLIYGRSGPISLHPPTVCFPRSGFEMIKQAERVEQPGYGQLQQCIFSHARTESRYLTMWSWSVDGRLWEAPDNPRFSFAKHRFLYKLYVLADADASELVWPARQQFLRDLLEGIRLAVDSRRNG